MTSNFLPSMPFVRFMNKILTYHLPEQPKYPALECAKNIRRKPILIRNTPAVDDLRVASSERIVH